MKKTEKNEQIERIQRHEALLDEALRLLAGADELVERLEGIKERLGKLEEYYSSSQWRKDFADDEEGLLPAGLKRGVLSEDGIYDALEDGKELFERIRGLLP